MEIQNILGKAIKTSIEENRIVEVCTGLPDYHKVVKFLTLNCEDSDPEGDFWTGDWRIRLICVENSELTFD